MSYCRGSRLVFKSFKARQTQSKSPLRIKFGQESNQILTGDDAKVSNLRGRNKANFILLGTGNVDRPEGEAGSSPGFRDPKSKLFGKIDFKKLNQRKSVEKNQKCDQFDKILVPDVFLPQSQGCAPTKIDRILRTELNRSTDLPQHQKDNLAPSRNSQELSSLNSKKKPIWMSSEFRLKAGNTPLPAIFSNHSLSQSSSRERSGLGIKKVLLAKRRRGAKSKFRIPQNWRKAQGEVLEPDQRGSGKYSYFTSAQILNSRISNRNLTVDGSVDLTAKRMKINWAPEMSSRYSSISRKKLPKRMAHNSHNKKLRFRCKYQSSKNAKRDSRALKGRSSFELSDSQTKMSTLAVRKRESKVTQTSTKEHEDSLNNHMNMCILDSS
ncbi:unnamed protein product [Moneuplotes crassus]|uniref:Uncharacterized protein n=1 Tax=Euplotes crassus TaxID=5936 RepID=A0AAD1UGY9_EUPCR|nr:unnamed protein product [Moneuplotes crassus]